MENLEKIIEEVRLKEGTSILWKACCDILRVLTIFGGSAWHTDLLNTLAEIWDIRRIGEEEVGLLQRQVAIALKVLNEKRIITSEKRLKADLSKPTPIEETLHSAKDYLVLLKTFGSNKEVLRYKCET